MSRKGSTGWLLVLPTQIREVKPPENRTRILGKWRVGVREGAQAASGSWLDEFAFSFPARGITAWAPQRRFEPPSRDDCSNQRVDPFESPTPSGRSRPSGDTK